jgi:hypothetical protein
MQDVRDTLKEGLEFYRDQERLISARLAVLPKGRVKLKVIGGKTYYYLQFRKGREFKSDYIGKKVPPELRDQLEERARLEAELRRVREGLRLLKSRPGKETDLTEPIRSILKKITEEKLWESGLEIIGTWCFLLYQRHLPVEKYPFRTEDLDILIPYPYKGRSFDFTGYLRGLGFRQDFHADGSMSFSGNLMKVEFLSPESGKGRRFEPHVKKIAVTPQTLRFIDILLDEPIVLQVARGIKARVPSPAAFALHKLMIATRTARKDKRDKDIRQAVLTAKYILSEKAEIGRLVRLWASFPRGWKARVRSALRAAQAVVPLEQGVIMRLGELLT